MYVKDIMLIICYVMPYCVICKFLSALFSFIHIVDRTCKCASQISSHISSYIIKLQIGSQTGHLRRFISSGNSSFPIPTFKHVLSRHVQFIGTLYLHNICNIRILKLFTIFTIILTTMLSTVTSSSKISKKFR